MGLDSYIWAAPSDVVEKLEDPDRPTFEELKKYGVTHEYPELGEFQYWRKHWGMHHWFTQEGIYRGDLDPKEEFNGVPLRIDVEMLQRLERDVRSGEVGRLGGEYGPGTQHDKTKDLAFIRKARKAIRKGLTLYYDSSW